MTADLLVLRAESRVGGETLLTIRSASQQGTKVRVQMGEQEVLVGAGAVGGLVHHEGLSAATIEGLCMWLVTKTLWYTSGVNAYIDGDTLRTTSVGGSKHAVKVLEQADGAAFVGTVVENTRNGVLRVLGVVTNDSGVDQNSQQSVLGCSITGVEDSHGIFVAQRR